MFNFFDSIMNVNNHLTCQLYNIFLYYLFYFLKEKKNINLINKLKEKFNYIFPDELLISANKFANLQLNQILDIYFESQFKNWFLKKQNIELALYKVLNTKKFIIPKKINDYDKQKMIKKFIDSLSKKNISDFNKHDKYVLTLLKIKVNKKEILLPNKKIEEKIKNLNIETNIESYSIKKFYNIDDKICFEFRNDCNNVFSMKDNKAKCILNKKEHLSSFNSTSHTQDFFREFFYMLYVHVSELYLYDDIINIFYYCAQYFAFLIENDVFNFNKFIQELIDEINILIKQKKYSQEFKFFNFKNCCWKNDQSVFFSCLKIFIGIDLLMKQYSNFVAKINHETNKHKYIIPNTLVNNDERINPQKFCELKSLNEERLFDDTEINFLTCLYNSEKNLKGKYKDENNSDIYLFTSPLQLRNQYVHNALYWENRFEDNKINFCIGLLILVFILFRIKDDINKNLKLNSNV